MRKRKNQNYIQAIAEVRSISAAAENLGISQPALSAYLKKAETELGAAIFDRACQSLEITEAGTAYLNYLERVEALRREMLQSVSDIQELRTGNVTVGGAVFFNVTYLPEAAAAFTEAYPGIDVDIVDGKVPELENMAQNGVIDIFITPVNDKDDRFCYEELIDERIFICVPAAWCPEKDGADEVSDGVRRMSGEELRALCDRTFIILRPNQDIRQRMDRLFEKYGCEPARTITAEQTMTTLALSRAGAGISLITESSAAAWNPGDSTVLYYIDDEICRRKMYVAYPRNKYLSAGAEEMIRFLKETNR